MCSITHKVSILKLIDSNLLFLVGQSLYKLKLFGFFVLPMPTRFSLTSIESKA